MGSRKRAARQVITTKTISTIEGNEDGDLLRAPKGCKPWIAQARRRRMQFGGIAQRRKERVPQREESWESQTVIEKGGGGETTHKVRGSKN